MISSPIICWFNSHFCLFILGPRFFTYLISTPNCILALLKRYVITMKFLLLFWGWSLLSKLPLTLEKVSFCSQTSNRRLDEPLWTMSPHLPFQVPLSLLIKPFGHRDLSTYPFSIHHSCFIFTCISFIQQEFLELRQCPGSTTADDLGAAGERWGSRGDKWLQRTDSGMIKTWVQGSRRPLGSHFAFLRLWLTHLLNDTSVMGWMVSP